MVFAVIFFKVLSVLPWVGEHVRDVSSSLKRWGANGVSIISFHLSSLGLTFEPSATLAQEPLGYADILLLPGPPPSLHPP